MKTTPITKADLERSVIAVPPLARNADFSLNVAANVRLIKHLEGGGVKNIMYGGNANFYHVTLDEYAELLAFLESAVAADTWVLPSVGPDYGKAMSQAKIIRTSAFPTAMLLPMSFPYTDHGLATGIRRITDAMGAAKPLQALEIRARNMTPGDTDLTWTRLTPWRALLTSALDQFPEEVSHVVVEADANNAAGMLLAAWLDDRLGCRVERRTSDGPGITKVTMTVTSGDISISRRDGKMASFSAPGTPSRTVALRRRDINTVITEELRRMDADDVLQAAMQRLISRCTDEGRAALGAPEKALKSSKGTQIE